jgi:hypothetical protein
LIWAFYRLTAVVLMLPGSTLSGGPAPFMLTVTRLLAAAAMLVTLTQAASAHDDEDGWYQSRVHDWHSG